MRSNCVAALASLRYTPKCCVQSSARRGASNALPATALAHGAWRPSLRLTRRRSKGALASDGRPALALNESRLVAPEATLEEAGEEALLLLGDACAAAEVPSGFALHPLAPPRLRAAASKARTCGWGDKRAAG
jgi:hypothetical protein